MSTTYSLFRHPLEKCQLYTYHVISEGVAAFPGGIAPFMMSKWCSRSLLEKENFPGRRHEQDPAPRLLVSFAPPPTREILGISSFCDN
jgi:hypothetical protein